MTNPTNRASSTSHGHGELVETEGGRWQVRFVRALAHPPEKVWRAVTEPDHLDEWFPTTIDGDRAAGAALVFRFRDGEGDPFDGTMDRYEPPRLMELHWGPDVLRIEVGPDGHGGSVLTLSDTFEEPGKAARDGTGWHVCLDALGAWLDGRSSGRAAELDRWREIQPDYVARFGPDFSSVGPPADHPVEG